MNKMNKPIIGLNTKRYLAELIDDLKAKEEKPEGSAESERSEATFPKGYLFSRKLAESAPLEKEKESPIEEKRKSDR